MTYYASGWVHVILGSLAIGLGGYLTTRGWDRFNSHSARRSLITAAFREWRQNEIYIGLMQEHAADLDKFSTPLLMSTLHYDAIEGLLTSPLFEDTGGRDGPLMNAVSDYLLNLKPVNDSITKMNYIVSSEITPTRRREGMGNFYGSALMSRFKQNHKRLGEELRILVEGPTPGS